MEINDIQYLTENYDLRNHKKEIGNHPTSLTLKQ